MRWDRCTSFLRHNYEGDNTDLQQGCLKLSWPSPVTYGSHLVHCVRDNVGYQCCLMLRCLSAPPPRTPCRGMTMTQQVLEAISFLSPLSRLSRTASCSYSKCTSACPKSDATRTSVFPSAISVTMGCESLSLDE